MKKLFWLIYIQPLYRIVLWMIAAVVLWGYLGKKAKGRPWWKTVNIVAFAGIVLAILYITICVREPGTREVVLIPFHSFVEAKNQPELYRAMLMNVLLFFPVGLSLPFVLPKDKFPVIITLALAFLLSGCIEMIQYSFCLGRCEADDVILNTLGAFIGALSFILY